MPADIEIAAAIANIFQALERLHESGMLDSKGGRIRREAIHFLWETRLKSKMDSSRRHSIAARASRQGGETALLRYEHSVPLASCMSLLRTASARPESMLSALETYIHPIIVLELECRLLTTAGLSSRMPPGAEAQDSMARYNAVGIEIEPG